MNNRTELTVKDMQKLNTYSFFKSMLFSIVLCFILVLCGIAILVSKTDNRSIGYGVTIIAVGVLITPLSYVFAVLGQNRQLKKHEFDKGFAYEYNFSKDGFQVRAISTNLDNKTSVSFSEIIKVARRKDCVYLFISKKQGYIVKYSGFESLGDKNKFLLMISNKHKK